MAKLQWIPWIHNLQHICPHLRCIQFYYIHNSKHLRTLLSRIFHVHVCTQFSYCIVHSFTTYASLLEVQFLFHKLFFSFQDLLSLECCCMCCIAHGCLKKSSAVKLFFSFQDLLSLECCCMCCIAHGCLKKSSAVNRIDGFTASILESTSLPFFEIDLHALEVRNFFSNV